MSKLRSAIIGFGSVSQTHVAAIKDGNISNITAVCDISSERLAVAESALPEVKRYTNYNKLLEDHIADVVHICTPHYLHMPMTVKALQTGHDVFLEKPAGMNVAEIDRIIEVAKDSGKRVCVSFQNRVIPSSWTAKCILDSGELGDIRGIKGLVTWSREGEYYTGSDWRGTWEKEGGGVLMNQSIHTLDLLCYFGGPIRKAEGTASLRKNKGIIDVDDTAEATIYFENGATGVFYATNCFATNSPVEIEVVCEKGSLLIRDDTLYKRVGRESSVVAENSEIVKGKSYWGAGHLKMINSFYSVLQGGNDYYCDISEALPSMQVIEEIYKNSKKTLVEKVF